MNLSSTTSSIEELKELISCCNDDQTSHVIWVDNQGEVHVTPIPREATPAVWADGMRERMRFRFETLRAGAGFVGPDAARDEAWMSMLYASLRKFWESGARGYRDHL